MAAQFKHFELKLVSPEFDSELTDALMELNHLRRMRLHGTTAPWIFFQLKEIFHILESVGSARIEGNRTTISDYIEKKIEKAERSAQQFSEIANVEQAMEFIEANISKGADISHKFIRELHQLCVDGLSEEGDRTPGAYRTWSVEIEKSNHIPPNPQTVKGYMDELVDFLNTNHGKRYDLIKIALAHHRFVWVHPFGNGNGRVVRLLTYALLIKFGFRVKEGQILNPTAVFCNDREEYYNKLSVADQGREQDLLSWCEYVLIGICEEISKVNKLLNHEYLVSEVLKPAINRGKDRGLINIEESQVLRMAVQKQRFKANDVSKVLPKHSSRQITHLISKLKKMGMILPIKTNGREYYVSFTNNYLMRSLIEVLEAENFIPSIND